MKWPLQMPLTSAGPRARAGFIAAPVKRPPRSPAVAAPKPAPKPAPMPPGPKTDEEKLFDMLLSAEVPLPGKAAAARKRKPAVEANSRRKLAKPKQSAETDPKAWELPSIYRATGN